MNARGGRIAYLEWFEAALREAGIGEGARRRILAEAEDHLLESAGRTSALSTEDADRLAIDRFGDPAMLARLFARSGARSGVVPVPVAATPLPRSPRGEANPPAGGFRRPGVVAVALAGLCVALVCAAPGGLRALQRWEIHEAVREAHSHARSAAAVAEELGLAQLPAETPIASTTAQAFREVVASADLAGKQADVYATIALAALGAGDRETARWATEALCSWTCDGARTAKWASQGAMYARVRLARS